MWCYFLWSLSNSDLDILALVFSRGVLRCGVQCGLLGLLCRKVSLLPIRICGHLKLTGSTLLIDVPCAS